MPKINPASFFGEVKSELTKVTWPSKEQVIKLTAVVVIISVFVGAFIGGLDLLFTKTIELIIKR